MKSDQNVSTDIDEHSATVGAVAFVLSLAFEPFIQQVVHFDQGLAWHDSTTAALPRTQRYSAGNRVPKGMVGLVDFNTSKPIRTLVVSSHQC